VLLGTGNPRIESRCDLRCQLKAQRKEESIFGTLRPPATMGAERSLLEALFTFSAQGRGLICFPDGPQVEWPLPSDSAQRLERKQAGVHCYPFEV